MSFIILLLFVAASMASENVHLELLSWGSKLPVELHVPAPPQKPSFVLLLVNDVPWTSSSLERQSGRFSVRAPRGHGLLATIQLVNLRKRNDYACSDYLKLSDPSGLLMSTVPICGSLKKEDKSFTPEGLIGPRVFHSASGKIDVFYESEPGDPESPVQGESNQVVEIVFTGYSDCLVDTFSQQMKCGDKCISHLLQCDDQLNCGFTEDFGLDEYNCTYSASRSSGSTHPTPTHRSSYLVSLYGGALLLVLMLVGIAFYHHRAGVYHRLKLIAN